MKCDQRSKRAESEKSSTEEENAVTGITKDSILRAKRKLRSQPGSAAAEFPREASKPAHAGSDVCKELG